MKEGNDKPDDSERLKLPGEENLKPIKPVKPASETKPKIKREEEVCHMCNTRKVEGGAEPPFMAVLVCSWCYKHEPRPENDKDKTAPKKDEAFYKSRVQFLTEFLQLEQDRMVKEQQAATEDEIKKIWGYKIDIVADVRRSVGEMLA